jgi:hypothetical protein
MAPYNFDDRNIKWNTLTLPPVGELKHLLFSILNVDGENHIVHVLFKFAANEKIILRRHTIHNNTFVVHGSRARDRLRHDHQQRLLGLERLCDRAGDTVPASSMYQTTNPATNALTGSPNTPESIAAGASQSFVIAFTLNVPFAPTIVMLGFDCSGVSAAPSNTGLNTLLLSASTTSVPDIVALVATAQNDGILHITGTIGSNAFAVATVNVGASASITATANTGAATLPLAISLCQTNPMSGQCFSSIGSSVTTTINSNATPTFAIFATASGSVPFVPQSNRIFVEFSDAKQVVRGSTSVAVETQ